MDSLLGALDAQLRLRGRGVDTQQARSLSLSLRIGGIAVSGGSVWITTGDALDRAQPDAALANQSDHTLRLPGFPADKRSELIDATTPAAAASTPAVSHVGNSEPAGGVGNTHRRHGVTPGRTIITRPSLPTHAP